MGNILSGLLNYLKDWRNLLTHALVGFAILGIMAFLPLPWYHRLAILLAVISFNITRMRLSKQKEKIKEN